MGLWKTVVGTVGQRAGIHLFDIRLRFEQEVYEDEGAGYGRRSKSVHREPLDAPAGSGHICAGFGLRGLLL